MRMFLSSMALAIVATTAHAQILPGVCNLRYPEAEGVLDPNDPWENAAIQCHAQTTVGVITCRFDDWQDCENNGGTWDHECSDGWYCAYVIGANVALNDLIDCLASTTPKITCLQNYCQTLVATGNDVCDFVGPACCTQTERPTEPDMLLMIHFQMTLCGKESHYAG